MMTETTDAIADYVDRCEPHLRDLPEDVRRQVRDDIEQIVGEVVAELDGAPDDLVGPPLRFVAELRAAAGLSAPPAATAVAADAAPPDLFTFLRSLPSHPAVRWCRGVLRDLRPAWPVVRGLLGAIALARLTGAPARPTWLLWVVPMWPVLGSTILFVPAAAGAVYLSVAAERHRDQRRRRRLAAAMTLVAVAMLFGLLGTVREASGRSFDGPPVDLVVDTPAAFSPVQIGSAVRGYAQPVTDADEAARLIDELLLDGPPRSIWVEAEGIRTEGMTSEALDMTIADLVTRGLLNPASPVTPGVG